MKTQKKQFFLRRITRLSMYIILTKKYKNLLQWNKIDSKVKIYISHKATEKTFLQSLIFFCHWSSKRWESPKPCCGSPHHATINSLTKLYKIKFFYCTNNPPIIVYHKHWLNLQYKHETVSNKQFTKTNFIQT